MQPSVCCCVIVDPDVNVAVAKAHADLDHPIRHAVMVCLDRVAAKQGAGAWSNGASMSQSCSVVAIKIHNHNFVWYSLDKFVLSL